VHTLAHSITKYEQLRNTSNHYCAKSPKIADLTRIPLQNCALCATIAPSSSAGVAPPQSGAIPRIPKEEVP
jgi:hypothetical protein